MPAPLILPAHTLAPPRRRLPIKPTDERASASSPLRRQNCTLPPAYRTRKNQPPFPSHHDISLRERPNACPGNHPGVSHRCKCIPPPALTGTRTPSHNPSPSPPRPYAPTRPVTRGHKRCVWLGKRDLGDKPTLQGPGPRGGRPRRVLRCQSISWDDAGDDRAAAEERGKA